MPEDVIVREFGSLRSGEGGNLSRRAYDFLKNEVLRGGLAGTNVLTLGSRNGRESLNVQNYVGVLSTPDGTVIEILPKHTSDSDTVEHSRRILLKMLSVVYGLNWKQATDAALDTRNTRLPDILVERFLETVGRLVRVGLRSDYLRCKEQAKYLKGRLNVAKQVRLPPTKRTDFCIEYDRFSVDRPENRLIKLALMTVVRWRLSPLNKRLAKELLLSFTEVEASVDVKVDFRSWRSQRDMVHYRPVYPWLQLILNELSPWTFSGKWQGISMLFPMEELFERYVYRMLVKRLVAGYSMKEQAQSEYLARHNGKPIFQLKPDILVKKGSRNYCIMDTKWKLLDQSAGESGIKYKLGQADFYQMFAYGHKYLGATGRLLLIFPRHTQFQDGLLPFALEHELELWALPYDLDMDELCLPVGLELPFLTSKPQGARAA